MQSSGTELLSSSVVLEAVVAGKRVGSGAACRVDHATDSRATLTGHAESSGLRVVVRHAVDLDGQVWTDPQVSVSAYVSGFAALLAVMNTGTAITARLFLNGRRLRLERLQASPPARHSAMQRLSWRWPTPCEPDRRKDVFPRSASRPKAGC